MCTSSSTTLFYGCENGVRCLDCRQSSPKVIDTVYAEGNDVKDLACVGQGKDQMLAVIVSDPTEVHLYYGVKSTIAVWKLTDSVPGTDVKMVPTSIALDGHGHLLVWDSNNSCMHMFAVSDGTYQGMTIRQGEQGLGDVSSFQWLSNEGSMLVGHNTENVGKITVFKSD